MTQKQKQIEKKNVRLQQELADRTWVAEELRKLRAIDQDAAISARKRLDVASERLHHATAYIEQLGGEKAALEQSRLIAAQGLMLERHDMLNRAAKLAMRVRGLGFDPNTFQIEF